MSPKAATSKKSKLLSRSARIAIANRGESAVRFIRAVKEFNHCYETSLTTVVFYLEVEQEALFVKEADEAYPFAGLSEYGKRTLGAYVDHTLMMEALDFADCDAVWPGWGFLSEDTLFAKMVEDSRRVFLGPSSRTMSLLGNKISAKQLAAEADVPILPGEGPIQDVKHAKEVAKKLGYPIIVKAANAGGGRGIRFVRSAKELDKQFRAAQEETKRIVNDDIVFIERLVERARHFEVQAICDNHGNVHTFGVRDCSVQRRNQKIIEETPPPHVSAEKISEVEQAAARLMKAANYRSAGTVECLYDLDREEFYFMEVNTRLQVEHPITEQLYQIDLVKMQIAVALGEKLENIEKNPRGVCIEVRLNAEDPDRDFAPAPGRVTLFQVPAGPGIRVDSGIEQGSTIPSEFDSMVAKIICYAPTRQETIARLRRALQEMRVQIEGGTTNRAFLLELLRNDEVKKGGVHTKFVEALLEEESQQPHQLSWEIALVACAIEQYRKRYLEELANFKQRFGLVGYFRTLSQATGYEVELNLHGNSYSFMVKAMGQNTFHIGIDKHTLVVQYIWRDPHRLLIIEGKRHTVQMVPRGDVLLCEIDGIPHPLEIESQGEVRAASPAMVISVNVSPGQTVAKGDLLVTLEAMKMEMAIGAPQDGVVKNVHVQEGEQVAAGQTLVSIDTRGEGQETGPTQPRFTFFSLLQSTKNEVGLVAQWQTMEREFLAVFLGYDYDGNPLDLLDKMVSFVRKKKEFYDNIVDTFLKGIEIFASIEELFSSERLKTESFARAMNCQELLMHFFRRSEDREKGLPEKFLDRFHRAVKWYFPSGTDQQENVNRVIFRFYQSHADIARKKKLLQSVLIAMEKMTFLAPIFRERERLPIILDELVRIAPAHSPSLIDAAVDIRYSLIDSVQLEKVKEESRGKVDKIIDLIIDTEDNQHLRHELIKGIIDAGHYIVFDLIPLALSRNLAKRNLALELLAQRFNRGRLVEEHGKVVESDNLCFYHLLCHTETNSYDTLVVVVREKELHRKLEDLFAYIDANTFASKKPEVILLVSSKRKKSEKRESKLFEKMPKLQSELNWLCLGFYYQDLATSYYTLLHKDGVWEEDKMRRDFSPLVFRELRVYRFANFHLEILYQSEMVYLVLLTARDNPKDQRFITFAEVSECHPEFDKDGSIRRIVAFEHAYTEAIHAIRAAQARRSRRLYWNRMIFHIRSFLDINLKQIEKYAHELAPRVSSLGLEKLALYARTMPAPGRQRQELEFLFENVSGNEFSITGRVPSIKILSSIDKYTSKVVRSRQRGMIYPYEIIRVITRSSHSGTGRFPRGEFEEYDLQYDEKTDTYKAVSVRNREAGNNTCNIIFGIITNFSKIHPYGLKRVLILGDPTTDMGALAEDECRRINAALDLAEQKQIPVEWVPISAGARIDMDSGTENLDWTAATLRRIIEFTQNGGDIHIIIAGVNVGAQSYWNAEATMLMHTKGLLIMTDKASMLLTGKKALDYSGSVSAEDNIAIGGAERIMGPNGQAQIWVRDLNEAYRILLQHYDISYSPPGQRFPARRETADPYQRNVCETPYDDKLGQGFTKIGDIFSQKHNPERKKPFDMRQVMKAVIDEDHTPFERWQLMKDAETAITWEARIGGYAVGLLGIESRPLTRLGPIANDGPDTWSGGTLFPQSSKKVARAINSYSDRLPLVVLANLSGFDGSPESLRNCQLEYGAEIGRAVVNFRGPILFVVVARYHGGAYVVFSRRLNSHLKAIALEGAYASVIGGAPAAAVVFPRKVLSETYEDSRIIKAKKRLQEDSKYLQKDFGELFQKVNTEKQGEFGQRFDKIHSVERAKRVGSIDDIISAEKLRPYLIDAIAEGMKRYEESL